jgi:hypothetical protein
MRLSKFAFMLGLTAITSGCSGQTSSNDKNVSAKTNTPDTAINACDHCGKASCDKTCLSSTKTVSMKEASGLKKSLPSCKLSASQLADRKAFLQSTISTRIREVKEMETGYDLIFREPREFAAKLLDFINFESSCCSSFTYALIFEPNDKAMHLQVYGSQEIKQELGKGFKALGLLK